MRKEAFAVAVLACMMAIGAETVHAQIPSDLLSFGGGLLFDGGRIGSFSEPRIFYEYEWWWGQWVLVGLVDEDWHSRANHRGIGAWGFVDATFAELSVGFTGGPWYQRGRRDGESWGEPEVTGLLFALDLALLGKFPIGLARGDITFFPLLGFGYNIVLSQRREGGDSHPRPSPRLKNTFRIMGGVGGDFDLSERLFYRVSILGAYRFVLRADREWSELSDRHDASGGGFGVIVKVGIGFRL